MIHAGCGSTGLRRGSEQRAGLRALVLGQRDRVLAFESLTGDDAVRRPDPITQDRKQPPDLRRRRICAAASISRRR